MRPGPYPRPGPVLLLLSGLLLAGCGRGEGTPALSGTYALDRAAYRRALLPAPIPKEPEQQATARDRASREADRIDVHLRLDADGSFLVRARYDKEEVRHRGEWTRRGDRITLRSTHTPAGRIERAEPIEARVEGEVLHFAAGVVPRPFVLRRQ